MRKYYTYAYLREDRTPYYIGKGTRRKYGGYTRATAKHPGISVPPKERILILKEFDCEIQSYRHEIYMISIFGRKDLGKGILYNKTDGGDGASNPSQEVRDKLGAIHRGKVVSTETRKKLSETRLKMNYSPSQELREHYSKLYKGSGNPNYGKKHSPETRKKISLGTKNKNLKVRWYITPEGKTIRVDNLREFCERNNLPYSTMGQVYLGTCNTCKGYKKGNPLY